MRKFVYSILAVSLILFMGCSESTDNDTTGDLGGDGEYTGFPTLKGGEWSLYSVEDVGRVKYEYIGKEEYEGKQVYVVEIEVQNAGVINQTWVDQDGNPVLYLMKAGGLVVKLGVEEIDETSAEIAVASSGETPEEYDSETKVRSDTFTTPTGKTVKVAVFSDGNSETWVSSEVPFGIVKVTEDGKIVMELHDFGMTGAVRDISREEADSATGFGFNPF